MDNSLQEFQFLDLDDLDREEADVITNILYTARPTRSVFPWILEQTTDWNQQTNYGEGGSEVSGDSGGPPGEVFPCIPPAVTTIQQQVYPPQVLQWVQQPAAPSYGAPPSGYFPQQDRRQGRTGKPSPKRQQAALPPQPVSYSPIQHAYGTYMVGHQYPYMTGPGIPSAQQAAGHPLYLAPIPSVFPPGAMYPSYQQVYSPIERKDETMPPGGPPPMQAMPPQPIPPAMPPVVIPQQPMAQHIPGPDPSVVEPSVPSGVPAVMGGGRMMHIGPPPMAHPSDTMEREPSPQPLVSPHPVNSPPQAVQSPPQPVKSPPHQVQPPQQSIQPPPVNSPPQQPQSPPQSIQSPPPPVPTPVVPPKTASVPPVPLPSQGHPIPHPSQPSGPPLRQPSPVNVPSVNQVAEEPVRAASPEKPLHSAPLNAIRKTGFPTSTKSWAGLFSKGSAASVVSSAPITSNSQASSVPASSAANMGAGDAQPGNPTPAESMTQVKGKCKPPASAVAIVPPPHMGADKFRPAFNTAPVTVNSSQSDKDLAEMLMNYDVEGKATLLTPRGLSNPSNYCYVNATLQALLGCAPFYNLLRAAKRFRPTVSRGRVPPPSATPVLDSMVQFVDEFSPSTHFKLCRKEKAQARRDEGRRDEFENVPSGPSFEPTYVYRLLQTVPSFAQLEGRQQDAEEFLNVLLNGLNDEMTELLKLVKPVGLMNGDVTTNGDTNHEIDSDWKEVTGTRGMRVTRRAEFGRSPLTDIFMGQLRSRLQRSDPHLSTDNVQPFFCLPLEIENCDNVTEALERLVGRDAIEGSDSYQQQYLDHLPLVLILHLKCFHYAASGPTKISKPIEVPIDLKLDTKYVTSKKMKLNYKLFAVTYHEGKEAIKGHYVSDVYHLGFSAWIRYDDTTVKIVPESVVMNPKPPRVPYLLYYRRNDTQPKPSPPTAQTPSRS